MKRAMCIVTVSVCFFCSVGGAFARETLAEDSMTTRTRLTLDAIRLGGSNFWAAYPTAVMNAQGTPAAKLDALLRAWPYALNRSRADLHDLWLSCSATERALLSLTAHTLITAEQATALRHRDNLEKVRVILSRE